MRKMTLIQQQSAASMLPLGSLAIIQRLISCVEAAAYVLLRRRILSAVAVCSIVWLASLWLAAALAQAQESSSNESGISVTQAQIAQPPVARTEADHLVLGMIDRNELEPGALPNSATQLTNPQATDPHSTENVLRLPSDPPGAEYSSLAALASAPSSSLPYAIQAKGAGQTDTGSPASDSKLAVYQFGPVNLVISGLPNSFSVSSAGSSVAGAR